MLASVGDGASAQPSDGPGPPRSAAVDAALKGRGLQTELRYGGGELPVEITPDTRPDDDAPAAPLAAPPEPENRPETEPVSALTQGLVLAAIALLILYGLYRARGRLAALFRRPQEGREAGREEGPPAPVEGRTPAAAEDGLAALRRMSDRGEALRRATRAAFETALGAQGGRWRRAETMRDALQSVPDAWPARAALARLSETTERVLFGGRPLSEREFETCLDLAETVLAASTLPAGRQP